MPNTTTNNRILVLSILFVLLWNSGFIGAEFILPYTRPFTLMFIRYIALFTILFIYLLIAGRLLWPGRRVVLVNMLVGILAHAGWLSCVLIALDNEVPAGIVALVVALQPLTTGAFSAYVVGEKTSLKSWIGLIIAFAGVVITVIHRMNFEINSINMAYIVPFGAVIAMTAAALIQRKIELKNGYDKLPLDLTLFYQSLGATLVLGLPALFLEKLIVQWNMDFILAMVWLILGVSFGAYTLMWILLKKTDAIRMSGLFFLGPPVTMLMAWFAFGDTLKLMDVVGLLIVLVGVVVTYVDRCQIRAVLKG
ncbi:MAG: DMT family transporter [Bacteroidales bacterium]